MNMLHNHHHVHFHFRNPSLGNQNQNRWCVGVGGGVSVSLRRKSDSEREIAVAARDRVIDFGKYKGKMLGSLPSSYVQWVSNNLRARHFEEWANLADQVLRDPIYRDRIEWEFALNVLNGNSSSSSSLSRPTPSPTAVSELLEISERFGWDNQDKVGWSKVDFDLLGTSKSGRIPRLVNLNLNDTQPKHKHQDHPPPNDAFLSLSVSAQGGRTRRMERRERQKMRLRRTGAEAQQQQNQQTKKNKNINMNNNMDDGQDEIEIGQNQIQKGIANPFPGRQALLRKAIIINYRTAQQQDLSPQE